LYYIFKQRKKFLKYTNDEWNGIVWTWIWDYDKSTKKYKITELNMLCPKCKQGVFYETNIPDKKNKMFSPGYGCAVCGYTQSLLSVKKPYYGQIRTEIIKKITKYSPNTMKNIEINNYINN
jgi:ribosomal protein S27AE